MILIVTAVCRALDSNNMLLHIHHKQTDLDLSGQEKQVEWRGQSPDYSMNAYKYSWTYARWRDI